MATRNENIPIENGWVLVNSYSKISNGTSFEGQFATTISDVTVPTVAIGHRFKKDSVLVASEISGSLWFRSTSKVPLLLVIES